MKKVLASVAVLLMFAWGNNAYAQFYAFGGHLTTVFYCSCMNAFWLTVVGPKPGSFIYYPGISRLYMNFVALIPGVNQLGTAVTTPVPCMTYIGTGCAPAGMGMPIIMMGTSLTP